MKKSILFALLGLFLVACGGGDGNDDSIDDQPGSKTFTEQWFIKRVPYTVDLLGIKINAITYFGGTVTMGELRSEAIAGNGSVIHLINENTLAVLSDDYFCEDGVSVSNKQLLYRVNTGTSLGILAFYSSSPTSYTYEKIDNKLYVPMWGKIFTITSEGLWEEGGQLYSSYNPNSEIFYL